MPSANPRCGVKEWIGCAAENFRAGRPRGLRPQAIVVHIMGGTLKETDGRFHDPLAAVSAHYGVGKSGEVHQYVDENDTAFHAGVVVTPGWGLLKKSVNPNFYTIGIEHEGMPDDPWSDVLYDTSAALIAEIAGRWNIPLDEDHIVRHSRIRASRTCPGPQVSIPQLIQMAAGKPDFPVVNWPGPYDVRLLERANARAKPTRNARIVHVLEPGVSFHAANCTAAGERVNGNSFWYLDPQEGYVWAGATDRPQPL